MDKQVSFLLLAAVCVVGVLVVRAEPVSVQKCGTGLVPTRVELTPCPSQPCHFKHGQTVDVKVTFAAPEDEKNLTASIYGYLGSVKVPWSMPNPDGCKDQGLTCPIAKGTTYTYHSTPNVLSTYPVITLLVQWQLDGGKNAFCFMFPMAIVA